MDGYVGRNGLQVEAQLAAFIETEALAGLGLREDAFWDGLAALVAQCGPRNRELLKLREKIHQKIDAWHLADRENPVEPGAYHAFLREIGYLVPEPEPFSLQTENVDPELAQIAGPQLVVPITNARYALNAANARWGSLYDALLRHRCSGQPAAGPGGYDAARGEQVIACGQGASRQGGAAGGRTLGGGDRLHLRWQHCSACGSASGFTALAEPSGLCRNACVTPPMRTLHEVILPRSRAAYPPGDRPREPDRGGPIRLASADLSCSRRRSRRSWIWRTASPASTGPTRRWLIATGSGLMTGRRSPKRSSKGRPQLHPGACEPDVALHNARTGAAAPAQRAAR